MSQREPNKCGNHCARDRFESIGAVAAGFVHFFRVPLMVDTMRMSAGSHHVLASSMHTSSSRCFL
jgi:hypothetical protein